MKESRRSKIEEIRQRSIEVLRQARLDEQYKDRKDSPIFEVRTAPGAAAGAAAGSAGGGGGGGSSTGRCTLNPALSFEELWEMAPGTNESSGSLFKSNQIDLGFDLRLNPGFNELDTFAQQFQFMDWFNSLVQNTAPWWQRWDDSLGGPLRQSRDEFAKYSNEWINYVAGWGSKPTETPKNTKQNVLAPGPYSSVVSEGLSVPSYNIPYALNTLGFKLNFRGHFDATAGNPPGIGKPGDYWFDSDSGQWYAWNIDEKIPSKSGWELAGDVEYNGYVVESIIDDNRSQFFGLSKALNEFALGGAPVMWANRYVLGYQMIKYFGGDYQLGDGTVILTTPDREYKTPVKFGNQ